MGLSPVTSVDKEMRLPVSGTGCDYCYCCKGLCGSMRGPGRMQASQNLPAAAAAFNTVLPAELGACSGAGHSMLS